MKKVLIITYYWPPAGGAGVQRVLKFAKYLPQFGWQPIILTVENPESPVIDETLKKDIPRECIVYKTKSLEPFNLYKKLTGKSEDYKIPTNILAESKSLKEKFSKWIRMNLIIPDAKIGWKHYAVKEGIKIIREEKIDLIFATSPPHTIQLIAKKLAKLSGLKWIADFRDPWLEMLHNQDNERSFLTKYFDSKLEKSVLQEADILISISPDMAKLLVTKTNGKKYYVIPNGFDETDFTKIEKVSNKNFTIAYTGIINNTRVPFVLLKALQKLIYEDKLKNIKFVIAGRTCDEFVAEVQKNNLQNFVEEKGFIPHNQSTIILQQADLLLLVIDNIPNNKGFLTGKIFEYLGARTPIFAIGPVNGNANEIIKNTNSGEMVDYSDENMAYQLLKKMHENWNANTISYKFEVEQYSRKKITESLANIFNEQIVK